MEKIIFLAFMLSAFNLVSLHAQTGLLRMEDASYINERLRSNSISTSGATNYNALVNILQQRFKEQSPESMGIDAVANSVGIRKLRELNLADIQRVAVEPFMDEICMLIQSESPQLTRIGELYNQAKIAEEAATQKSYESILAEFHNDGFLAIEQFRSDLTSVITTVNWEAMAIDAPEYTKNHFERICRYRDNPNFREENAEIVELIDQLNRDSNSDFFNGN